PWRAPPRADIGRGEIDVASGFDRPQNTRSVYRHATLQVSLCRSSRRRASGRLLGCHRLSSGGVAAITTNDRLITGALTWPLADRNAHLIHCTLHPARGSVAPDRVRRRRKTARGDRKSV